MGCEYVRNNPLHSVHTLIELRPMPSALPPCGSNDGTNRQGDIEWSTVPERECVCVRECVCESELEVRGKGGGGRAVNSIPPAFPVHWKNSVSHWSKVWIYCPSPP